MPNDLHRKAYIRTTLFIAMVGWLTATTVCAESTKPQFRSFMNGISCGEVITDLNQQATSQKFAILIGSFISGSNYSKHRDSKMDLKGMLLITEQFCRQNPEHPATAALVFLDQTIDKRIELEHKSRSKK
ncbi:MAG: hypothetical protein KAU27_14820 [Desulfuromonadales bacterium]|nr:hypothetical protein [Desulfuromonadales bacterium]